MNSQPTHFGTFRQNWKGQKSFWKINNFVSNFIYPKYPGPELNISHFMKSYKQLLEPEFQTFAEAISDFCPTFTRIIWLQHALKFPKNAPQNVIHKTICFLSILFFIPLYISYSITNIKFYLCLLLGLLDSNLVCVFVKAMKIWFFSWLQTFSLCTKRSPKFYVPFHFHFTFKCPIFTV